MPRGRPRKFDLDRALGQAMKIFWQHGYGATSLEDLTAAIGITKPSLYAAFGDKEQLFLKALDRYSQLYGGQVLGAVAAESDIYLAMKAYLDAVAAILSGSDCPAGCLWVNSTLESRHLNEAINRKIIEHQARCEAGLYNRLRQAQIAGQIPVEEDIQALAQFFVSTGNAMAVMTRVYPDPIKLQQMIDLAMRVFPTKASSSRIDQ